MPSLVEDTHRLNPAENLFDPLPFSLIHFVTVMPCRASVNRAAARSLVVLRNMRHTIRGTLAQAKVGPDLTHVASRYGLAANALRNDTANLEAWVTHAQALKPNVVMPDMTEFTGQEVRDLVAYLEQLR